MKKGNKDPQEINQDQGRYFDQVVDLFDTEQPKEIQERLNTIVSLAKIQPGETILDVGAGVGVLVPFLKRYRPSKIIACDLSKGMLGRLKDKYPFVEIHQSALREINIPDETIDVIFMNAMFSNISDKPATFRCADRILRPKGRLVISHPEGKTFVEGLRKMVSFPLDPLPIFPQLREMLKDTSLRMERYIDRKKFYFAMAVKIRP